MARDRKPKQEAEPIADEALDEVTGAGNTPPPPPPPSPPPRRPGNVIQGNYIGTDASGTS
ncbi:MAG TPA: hypothetical protein VEC11_06180 [Allosphingosinicella sp.]|nr:hypothetical protein [Allosphingosinicella sp.]